MADISFSNATFDLLEAVCACVFARPYRSIGLLGLQSREKAFLVRDVSEALYFTRGAIFSLQSPSTRCLNEMCAYIGRV